MSAIPQTIEEASGSLQKIIDHPRTRQALLRQPQYLAKFPGARPRGKISPQLAKDYSGSWMQQIVGKAWISLFFVAPMSDGKTALTIFTESEIEDVKARFGLWDVVNQTMREIQPSEISSDLEKMQYVLNFLVRNSLGDNRRPEISVYI